MNVNYLFPIPVAAFHIERDFTVEEKCFVLDGLQRRQNNSNQTSENSYILNAPEMSDIREFADRCAEQYAREVWFIQPECTLQMTQSWANYTVPGAAHHKHSHANSLFSGVLYLQAEDDRDQLHFYRYDQSNLRPSYTQFNIVNAESWWLPAPTGSLLLFPSTMAHSVVKFGGELERCSIAFNLFPRGVFGDELGLTEARV